MVSGSPQVSLPLHYLLFQDLEFVGGHRSLLALAAHDPHVAALLTHGAHGAHAPNHMLVSNLGCEHLHVLHALNTLMLETGTQCVYRAHVNKWGLAWAAEILTCTLSYHAPMHPCTRSPVHPCAHPPLCPCAHPPLCPCAHAPMQGVGLPMEDLPSLRQVLRVVAQAMRALGVDLPPGMDQLDGAWVN